MVIKMYDLAGAEDNRRFSPYCWRVRMALAHKGREVATIPWHFTEKETLAAGHKEVPVIVDGDTIVADSWNIAGYLEETYPGSPLFGSSHSQGLTLFVKHWDERVLAPALFPLLVLDIEAHLHEKDKTYFRQKWETKTGKRLEDLASDRPEKLTKFCSLLDPLRKTLRLQPFLAGEQPHFADYIVFARFQFARCTSPLKLLEVGDSVYAWRDRMLKLYDGLADQAVGYD